MAKDKLGIKRLCLNCGKRFYDMQRDPIYCPSCGAKLETNPSGKTRRQRNTVDKNITTLKVKSDETNSANEVQQVEEESEFLEDNIEENIELEVEDETVDEMLDGIEDTEEENT